MLSDSLRLCSEASNTRRVPSGLHMHTYCMHVPLHDFLQGLPQIDCNIYAVTVHSIPALSRHLNRNYIKRA